MRVAIAQLNPNVGDIQSNLDLVKNGLEAAAGDKAELVVFPELFLVGYPPRDLLEREEFIAASQLGIKQVVDFSREYPGLGIIIGAPTPTGLDTGRGLYNSALFICDGSVQYRQHKSLLPIYDVFDEVRYFDPAMEVGTIFFRGETLGISVCEDAWNDPELWPKQKYYLFDPITAAVEKGATILINISASPFFVGKEEIRYRLISNHAQKHLVPFIYVNQVGGNDELIFDGTSMALDRYGNPLTVLPSFEEIVFTVDTSMTGQKGGYQPQEPVATVYQALVLGLKDYIRKCGFSKTVIGLSGGIDSAVTCCLACAAVGPDNVLGISMPSSFSSKGSVEDSRILAQRLGIEFRVIPISTIYDSYLEMLKPYFESAQPGLTEENIQARIRGNVLMAFSNQYGSLVLSTGNKSELAVGYCTLYGDMSGGLSVLADLPKTMVYQLAEYINREREIIPAEIITKPPSAELKPDQLDQDTLPPYPILDDILALLINENLSSDQIIARGFDPATVEWVAQAVIRSEYKRKQAAPGLKITTKAFGPGRRMPIAAKYQL